MRISLVILIATLPAVSGCFGLGGPGPRDFVSDSRYSSMLIEVFYDENAAPRDAAIELLEQRAHERLSKPGGIEVQRHAFDGDSRTWSSRDLSNLADDRSSTSSTGGRAVLTVLYVDGNSDGDTSNGKVLGVFFQKGRIAVFPDAINGGGLLGFGASDIERAVLVHEFGHAIGLVNLGIPMQTDHEDDAHEKHSSNSQSVMYWAVENTLGLSTLTGGIPNDFDTDDRADLKAAGGK